LDGSERRLLLNRVGHAYGVAVVEGVVYWTDRDTDSIWRASISDTATTTTTTATNTTTTTNGSVLEAGTRQLRRRLVVDKLPGLMDLHTASRLVMQHTIHRQ